MLWPAIEPSIAMHSFLVATLAGAASLLPGGLGAMELTLLALLAAHGMPTSLATAAVLAIRAVTLWFGIFLGLISLNWIQASTKVQEPGDFA
jgi:uncharacterized protein (TIRG00374 family)